LDFPWAAPCKKADASFAKWLASRLGLLVPFTGRKVNEFCTYCRTGRRFCKRKVSMENEDHIELYVNSSWTIFTHLVRIISLVGQWKFKAMCARSRCSWETPHFCARSLDVSSGRLYPCPPSSNGLLEGRRRAECGILPEQRLASGQGESALSDSFRAFKTFFRGVTVVLTNLLNAKGVSHNSSSTILRLHHLFRQVRVSCVSLRPPVPPPRRSSKTF
jgi:hypothetical protein